jgi:hypothetical protein
VFPHFGDLLLLLRGLLDCQQSGGCVQNTLPRAMWWFAAVFENEGGLRKTSQRPKTATKKRGVGLATP